MADPVLQSTTCPHFFQPLLPGFDSYLNIPVTFFLKHVERSNEQRTANLRSDASDTTWEVKIDGRSRRLTGGWKEFATAHDFRVGDIIVFRHEGDLVFHVTALGPSCCEIQYVQSCNDDNLDDDQEDIRNLPMEQSLKTELEAERSLDDDDEDDNMGKFPRKKHVEKEIPEAEAKSFSSDKSCFVAHVTDSNLRNDTLFLPTKFVRSDGLIKGSNKIVLMNEEIRTWTLILKFRDSSRSFYMRGGWRSFAMSMGLNLEIPSRLN
ncbi:LOW QUALITY PROTEIN: B3 domain-containing protein REM7 [Arabidopsis lyrata subsp. lyrata]|uniref:LOW QUALITY PROTEIN: B3 domain-containing protein REM7 n=1 Tax=Arabidopsis lyrata subsp. lyrata TaxID=81972 RepID=UPI000A29D26D|nr:LOW QUALITY PROTEIN: B3 domain-containing protein REM7 [Arabidopsis lyrata subsp. lyrata]|eukprot:XP_020872309.1 LOW QUALITY PROTEIN: B3 domain-containing protein REM7 [Arabidopsis lyrata subsp. lyrata]